MPIFIDTTGLYGDTAKTQPAPLPAGISLGGAGVVEFGDGSAASPSIRFSSDTNTGIFRKAADSLGFAEGGIEIGSYDANGSWTLGPSAGGSLEHSIRSGAQTTLRIIAASGSISRLQLGDGVNNDIYFGRVAGVSAKGYFASDGTEVGSFTSTGQWSLGNATSPATAYHHAYVSNGFSFAARTVNTAGNGSYLGSWGSRTADGQVGGVEFSNLAGTGTAAEIARIDVLRSGANNSGQFNFITRNAGVAITAMSISPVGAVTMGPASMANSLYQTINGSIVGRATASQEQAIFGGAVLARITVNSYFDATGNTQRAIKSATGFASLDVATGALATDVALRLNTNRSDAQTANSTLVTTNQLTVLEVTQAGAVTLGPTTGTANLNTVYGFTQFTTTARASSDFAPVQVVRPSANTGPHIQMTREGILSWGLGVNTSNSLEIGLPSSSSAYSLIAASITNAGALTLGPTTYPTHLLNGVLHHRTTGTASYVGRVQSNVSAQIATAGNNDVGLANGSNGFVGTVYVTAFRFDNGAVATTRIYNVVSLPSLVTSVTQVGTDVNGSSGAAAFSVSITGTSGAIRPIFRTTNNAAFDVIFVIHFYGGATVG